MYQEQESNNEISHSESGDDSYVPQSGECRDQSKHELDSDGKGTQKRLKDKTKKKRQREQKAADKMNKRRNVFHRTYDAVID